MDAIRITIPAQALPREVTELYLSKHGLTAVTGMIVHALKQL
jgi:hypothetical protein